MLPLRTLAAAVVLTSSSGTGALAARDQSSSDAASGHAAPALESAGAPLVPPTISIVLRPQNAAVTIPEDFSGLSYDLRSILPEPDGRSAFSTRNRELLALFRTLGIHSLRVGGNTVDNPAVPRPTSAQWDAFFEFARAANVRVIFGVRLKNGDPAADAAIVGSILPRYAGTVEAVEIGNEVDNYENGYDGYAADFRRFVATICEAAPSARFAGPGIWTPSNLSWVRRMAEDCAPDPRFALATIHVYPGESQRKVPNPAEGRDRMLSPEWEASYEVLRQSFAPAVAAQGLPYRLEEANNYFHSGGRGFSDTFAAGLWALDFLHWWAAHGAAGVNFHTGNGPPASAPAYSAFTASERGYFVQALGYALKAFELTAHGRIVPLNLKQHPDIAHPPVHLSAYAFINRDGFLAVTLINKEHGPNAATASVAVTPAGGGYAHATCARFEAPAGLAATSGLLLGGSPIDDTGAWNGSWTPLPPPAAGAFAVNIPPSSAALILIKP